MSYLNSENNIDYHFKSATSFSHLVGCITALIIDYVKTPFPDGFFKTIRCTTEVPFNERANWLRETAKKPRPLIVIDPKFDISEDTKFLPSTEFDALIPDEPDRRHWNTLDTGEPFMYDDNHTFEMYNKVARYKITFTVTFIFDSPIQQMQVQEHMRQNIRHQMPTPINRFVEHNIPQHFMDATSVMLGLDVNSPEFIAKVNELSTVPISHRVRPGSGNKEFFCLSPSTLHVLFTSLPASNGNERVGKVITSASFTENIEVEFAANSTYFLRTNVNVGERIDMSELAILAQTTMTPGSAPVKNVFDFPDVIDTVYRKTIQLNVQFDMAEQDTIDLSSFVVGEVRRMVEYHNSQNLDITFLKCLVYEQSAILDETRVAFNPKDLTVTVTNTDNFKLYVVALFCDFAYINNLKISLAAFDDFTGTA